jgi:hypothetical protein
MMMMMMVMMMMKDMLEAQCKLHILPVCKEFEGLSKTDDLADSRPSSAAAQAPAQSEALH